MKTWGTAVRAQACSQRHASRLKDISELALFVCEKMVIAPCLGTQLWRRGAPFIANIHCHGLA
jgi:hypothetical protein